MKPYTKQMHAASDALDRDVLLWLRSSRASADPTTYRQLSAELADRGVMVKPETLRRWYCWWRTGR